MVGAFPAQPDGYSGSDWRQSPGAPQRGTGWQNSEGCSSNWWADAPAGSIPGSNSCGRRGFVALPPGTPETLAPSSHGASSVAASSEPTSPSGSPRSNTPSVLHLAPAPVSTSSSDASSVQAFGTSPSLSRQPSATSTATTSASGSGVDEEVVRYAKWLSSRAGHMDGLDQKLAALSKRSAAEFRRVDREHGEHVRRLEALEEICSSRLEQAIREVATAEAAKAVQRLQTQLEERLQQDFKRVSEDMSRLSAEAQRKHKQCSEALEGLAHHIDGSNAGLDKWRKEVDVNSQTLLQDLKKLQTWSTEMTFWKKDVDPKLLALGRLSARANEEEERGSSAAALAKAEEACRTGWEAAVRRERKIASERLSASCTELTQHLNELREELLEQRTAVSTCSKELRTSRQEAHQGQKLRDMWLEAQVSELGAALAVQIDEKLRDQPRAQKQEVGSWRRELEQLRELALDAARDEARIVHNEVMSLDMRVATLEGR